jgi:hypothetical protein
MLLSFYSCSGNKLNPNSSKPPAPPVDEVLVGRDFAASTGGAGGFHVRFIS